MKVLEIVKKQKEELLKQAEELEKKLQELNQFQLKLNQNKEDVITKLIGVKESINTLDKIIQESQTNQEDSK